LRDIAERDGSSKKMAWTVSDVMARNAAAVAPSTSFKSCAKLMRIHELTAVPVVDGGIVVGIVSEADLLAKEARRSLHPRHGRCPGKATAMTVSELMTGDLVTTTEDAPLAIAASLMFEHHLKVLPVVNSAKRLVGTVTRSQVLNVFLRSDESIRREVARELRLAPPTARGTVDAEVREGVVHLYGEVEKETATDLWTRLVAVTPGVVAVVSHLKITSKPAAAAAEVGSAKV
jgi:CBS domain-containing protein